jgi:beta-phosphoglucomutase-like phosphatase (HAD superfamily)
VAHTEATAANAYYRLAKLGIAGNFRRLYVSTGRPVNHPDPERAAALAPPEGLVMPLPPADRKPNPRVIRDICRRERIDPQEAVYVGDSLTRDVAMALSAGVTAAWAKYGTAYDPKLWDLLVKVTHWTDDDVQREALLRQSPPGQPDVTLGSFDDLLPLFGLGRLIDLNSSGASARTPA